MRAIDKLKNIKKANLIVERIHIETKNMLHENEDTYFNTLAEALAHVREMAENLGYGIDEDAMWNAFGTGGVSYGETKKGLIPLTKDGKPMVDRLGRPLNRAIAVAIYRMDSGKYDLTAYKTF